MVGCRHNAKNTLVKNYLWFAEKLGVEILAERQVTDIRPVGGAERRLAGLRGRPVSDRARGCAGGARRSRPRGVIVAAGALGTNKLLAELPAQRLAAEDLIAPRRTGADQQRVDQRRHRPERLNATSPSPSRSARASTPIPTPMSRSSPTGAAADSMSYLFTLLTGKGSKLTRPLLWLGQMLRHPIRFARLLWPFKWSRRTVILLVMQTLDNAIRLRPEAAPARARDQAADRAGPGEAQPDLHPGRRRRCPLDGRPRPAGSPRAGSPRPLFNIPTTAHILGGAVIGADPEHGVVDARQPRLRLREPAGLRRRRDPGQPGRQPEPDDHRAGRARDVRRARQGGFRTERATPVARGRPSGSCRLTASRLRLDAHWPSPS